MSSFSFLTFLFYLGATNEEKREVRKRKDSELIISKREKKEDVIIHDI